MPFTAALAAGRHIKCDFSKPDRLSEIPADFDISAHLGRLEEHLTATDVGLYQAWEAIAATLLASTPQKLWNGHKVQAVADGKTAG